jgi:putative DNA primase/helicase
MSLQPAVNGLFLGRFQKDDKISNDQAALEAAYQPVPHQYLQIGNTSIPYQVKPTVYDKMWQEATVPFFEFIQSKTIENSKKPPTKASKMSSPAFGFGMPLGSSANTPDFSQVDIVTLDIDKLPESFFAECWPKIKLEYVTAAYKTSSGKGLRVLCRTKAPLQNEANFKATVLSIAEWLSSDLSFDFFGSSWDDKGVEHPYLDSQTFFGKNAWLLGRDPAFIYFNENSVRVDVKTPPPEETETRTDNADTVVPQDFVFQQKDAAFHKGVLEIMSHYFIEGQRNEITLYLAGLFAKKRISLEIALEIVRDLSESNGDDDTSQRLQTVKATYRKVVVNKEDVAGSSRLKEILSEKDFQKLQALLGNKGKGRVEIEFLVDAVLTKFKIVTLENNPNHPIYLYNPLSGIWCEEGAEIDRFIQEKVGPNYFNENLLKNIKLNIRTLTLQHVDFDRLDRYIVFENGYVDLSANEINLEPHSPDIYATISIPHRFDQHFLKLIEGDAEYRETADFKSITFLKSIVKKEDFANLMKLTGISLTTKIVDKLFFLVGEGENGKSRYIEMLQKLVGKRNYSNETLHRLATEKFAAASLVGKIVNVFADITDKRIMESNVLKCLATGDEIPVEAKFKDPYFARLFSKLIFSANSLPAISDNTHGFWRRPLMIEFPFKFTFHVEEIDNLNVFQANADVLAFTDDEDEMSVLITYAICYLRLWMKERFTESENSEHILSELRQESNSTVSFVSEYVMESTNASSLSVATAYKFYSTYCKTFNFGVENLNNFRKHFRNAISTQFKTLDYKKDRSRASASYNEWVYVGVELDEEKLKERILQAGGSIFNGGTWSN